MKRFLIATVCCLSCIAAPIETEETETLPTDNGIVNFPDTSGGSGAGYGCSQYEVRSHFGTILVTELCVPYYIDKGDPPPDALQSTDPYVDPEEFEIPVVMGDAQGM